VEEPLDRPRVVVHAAVSVDGSTSGFRADVARYYALAATWPEDVTLAGADTILAQEQALATAPRPGPAADGPLLAVVDSRRRVRAWDALRACGHWSDVVALRGEPAQAPAGIREIATGGRGVDLAVALRQLRERFGARLVRVDSGGTLIGALLRARAVDEVSLLVHPSVVGGHATPWWGPADTPPWRLERRAAEALGDGLVWLRYEVVRAAT
jgi:2,5-diamino-6-(ribosylamino)-4(3H)-pyrimidinone 5'-phosphate reductase